MEARKNLTEVKEIMLYALAIALMIAFMVGVVVVVNREEDGSAKPTDSESLYAMIKMPDGSIVEGQVENARINRERILLEIDGVKYLTSIENVILVEGENNGENP